jgi:hypothetical protein
MELPSWFPTNRPKRNRIQHTPALTATGNKHILVTRTTIHNTIINPPTTTDTTISLTSNPNPHAIPSTTREAGTSTKERPWFVREGPWTNLERSRENAGQRTTKPTRSTWRLRKGFQPPPAILTKRPSRRISQRANKRNRKTDTDKKINKHKKGLATKLVIMTKYIEQECQKRYGFHADPLKPKWMNEAEALTTMDTILLLSKQQQNIAFHNLDNTNLPAGTNELLGLGLKF